MNILQEAGTEGEQDEECEVVDAKRRGQDGEPLKKQKRLYDDEPRQEPMDINNLIHKAALEQLKSTSKNLKKRDTKKTKRTRVTGTNNLAKRMKNYDVVSVIAPVNVNINVGPLCAVMRRTR